MHFMSKTTLLSVSCSHESAPIKWIADMVTIHIWGIWRFLRIGVGAEEINCAFCILCLGCLEKMTTMTIEEEAGVIRKKAFSRAYRE
jgi:hypothetical protein